MNLKMMKLNEKTVKPLKELVGILLEQLEIAEREIDELHESNEHFQRRFEEVRSELERVQEIKRIERGEKK